MFCPNCGKEIERGAKFCKACGTKSGQLESDNEKKQMTRKVDIRSYKVPKMIPGNMLKSGENIILETHPHRLYSLIASWFFGGIFFVGGIFLLFGSPYIGVAALFLGLLILLIPFLKWKYTIYVLTTVRIMTLRGMIAKDFYENPLDKIQDLRLKMGIMQRLFGCGDIMITTAGTAAIECNWKNIPKPNEVQKILRNALDR